MIVSVNEWPSASKGQETAFVAGSAEVYRIVLDVAIVDGWSLWRATAALLASTGLSDNEIIECIGCDKTPFAPECLLTLCSSLKFTGCELLEVDVLP